MNDRAVADPRRAGPNALDWNDFSLERSKGKDACLERLQTPFSFCNRAAAVLTVEQFNAISATMIICSCNVLSDHEVRAVVTGAAAPPTTGEVYGCLGCSAQCGRCARTIRRIMDEALGCAALCGRAARAGR